MARYDPDDFDEELDIRRQRGGLDRPHSGTGMAALVMGVVAAVGAACAVVIFVALDSAPPGLDDDLWMGLAVLLFLGCGALAVAGFVLSLVGACQSDRNPLFGILGTVASALTLVGAAVVVCLGIFSDF